MSNLHSLSGLTQDEHLWLMAILRDDWETANVIAKQIDGNADLDLSAHMEEIHYSMRPMVGPTTWARLQEQIPYHSWDPENPLKGTVPAWTDIWFSLSCDLKFVNLRMLRAFLKSEAWRRYIYGMMYPEADLAEAYWELEEEEED